MSDDAEKTSVRIGPERSVDGSLEAVSLTKENLDIFLLEIYLRGCRPSKAEFV